MASSFDVIVVGAGSVGMPSAMELAEQGLKVLCIDQFASPGQGSNKAAIGGLRATHSAPAKIRLCLDALDTVRPWKERHGDDLEWFQGGYAFVAYGAAEEKVLKDLLKVQKAAGLAIDWLDGQTLLERVPGLNPEGLLGGTLSPEDGSASPMRTNLAFYRRARELGVQFRFNERVTAIIRRKGRVVGVRTDKGGYATDCVVNAAGAWARQLAFSGGLERAVDPDCHEAGITEPVARFLDPMLVDIRKAPGSANYYFHQSALGQVIFCITPDPAVLGSDRRETSAFLPLCAKRMVQLMPKVAHLKVRRTWRGLYPMTPDGFPIAGYPAPVKGYALAVGMCGQGFMLGPGLGSALASVIAGEKKAEDLEILAGFRLDRNFSGQEQLK